MARMADEMRGTWAAGRDSQGRLAAGRACTALTIAAKCAGVVPQQPPTTRTPRSATNSASIAAIGSGSSGYTASPAPVLSGKPALGMHEMGRPAFSVR